MAAPTLRATHKIKQGWEKYFFLFFAKIYTPHPGSVLSVLHECHSFLCPSSREPSAPSGPAPLLGSLSSSTKSASEVPHCAATAISQADSSLHGELCQARDKVVLIGSPLPHPRACAHASACALSLCPEQAPRPGVAPGDQKARPELPQPIKRSSSSSSSEHNQQTRFVLRRRRQAYEAEKVFVGGLLPADLPRLPLCASAI